MALTLECKSTDPLSIGDFISKVSSEMDPRDTDSIRECGEYLYRLSLDKTLFDNIMSEAIETYASSDGLQESFNGYREMTFLLGKCTRGEFFVRANVWKPPKVVAGDLDLQNDIYSYNLAHDHNYDFITAGYFGPGYKTQIFEYDYRTVRGIVGEHVDIRHLEETVLTVGKVMMYRKSVDIHTQLPPSDISVSINLMIQPPIDMYREQYTFDIRNSTIAGYVEGPVNYQVSLLSMAAVLGGENLLDPLLKIAQEGASGRTRAAAIDAILSISDDLFDTVFARCEADRHPLVARSLASRGRRTARDDRVQSLS